ncbi:hypothetical protein [Pigmentiphaga daeguensis]|uniref:Uncharacterized protein n=1 Tax=Pigmentiphaga daeguensis TaxID=414049 RepID=A0ABP3L317_9BURK
MTADKSTNIPVYQPYRAVRLLSNTAIETPELFLFSGQPILRIGRGNRPIVWLWANRGGRQVIPIVEGNKPVYPGIEVQEEGDAVTLSILKNRVLIVRQTAPDDVSVEFIDLRPAGFTIYGSGDALIAGNTQMVGNITAHCGSFLAFD